jgi:glycosyltransferase involved in cell wall biosynthesis
LPPRSQLETRFPELRGRRWLLFLSRLHPKKGLDELIAAWRALQDKFPDWHLVLAGPDLNGYRRTLDRLIAAAGVARRVTVTGMLADDDKRAAFGHAGLFVLPTHSENFGVAVAEALAFKVPVVTTKAAPWAELESERCGWWINDSTEALVAALGSALRMREEDLEAMGRRGQSLMERKYSWRRVGEQMLSAYQWCCSRGERPHCVQQD